MTEPSGTLPNFGYVSNVTNEQFEEARDSLDRAILRAAGLPVDVEIVEFENAAYAMTDKINILIKDFTVPNLIILLPELIVDALMIWTKLEPKLSTSMDRKQFVTSVIVYAYRKHDPDIPYLVEPYETMVEDMLLAAIPGLINKL